MFSEAFDQALTQAIVNQFFTETPGFQDGNGVWWPTRVSPVKQVVAQMLTEKQEELVKKVVSAIDLDELAGDISDQIFVKLTEPDRTHYSSWGYDTSQLAKKRNELKEKIDARFVELMAQKMFDDLQAMPPTTIDTEL